ncbi:MAG: GGDEF domain-containing protein [Clostridiales bacterium]|nr:GGDEF domain-containing protein [Clostridiales bacterium]
MVGACMYTEEQLNRIPYFADLLKDKNISNILDSLTGTILRPYIIGYIRYLISNEIPFTLGEVDLDNFKFINDTYGHKVGDGVLQGVSADLMRYLADYGLVGRIGGDEFLIINRRDIEYADKKKFYLEMYANYNVLRKNISLGVCDPFITGTVGSATYPNDATTYDELFHLVDKTLYRGKTKGRNCYIIYLEEKHKDIQIQELKSHGLYTTLHNLALEFDTDFDIHKKLQKMFPVLKEDMRITDFFYITEEDVVHDVLGNLPATHVGDISALMKDDIFTTNTIDTIRAICPDFSSFLEAHEYESVLILNVGIGDEKIGYLMCAEPRSLRIWQQDERAIVFSVARMLAGFMKGTHQKL